MNVHITGLSLQGPLSASLGYILRPCPGNLICPPRFGQKMSNSTQNILTLALASLHYLTTVPSRLSIFSLDIEEDLISEFKNSRIEKAKR